MNNDQKKYYYVIDEVKEKMTEDTTESEGVTMDTEEDTGETTSTDGTAEDVKTNDPEKNKKLAQITISEKIRDTYNLTLNIPRILKGLHTNQFFFMEVSDEFYERNYGSLADAIGGTKFARYAGFEKGRFFVEKVEYWGGIDGTGMTLTLNPLPNNYGTYMKAQQEAEKALIQAINDQTVLANASGGGGTTSDEGGGLTTMNGSDCSETYGIATRSYNINETANHQIGNSSANYAQDTASMSARSAVMDCYNRFKYSGYANNRTCPQNMWNKGTIRGNCADISRLCMCVGQVHGMTIGIHHMSGHYYNLIQVNGQTYRFDCCCKSSGSYRGEITNNLTKRGGPWS